MFCFLPVHIKLGVFLQELMQQNQIVYVLNASNTCPKPDFVPDSHFLRVPVNDSFCEKILPWLDRSVEFIGRTLGSRPFVPVLIWTGQLTWTSLCCRKGQSIERSRPGSLSRWDLSLGHHRHRLHHEEDGHVAGRGVQVGFKIKYNESLNLFVIIITTKQMWPAGRRWLFTCSCLKVRSSLVNEAGLIYRSLLIGRHIGLRGHMLLNTWKQACEIWHVLSWSSRTSCFVSSSQVREGEASDHLAQLQLPGSAARLWEEDQESSRCGDQTEVPPSSGARRRGPRSAPRPGVGRRPRGRRGPRPGSAGAPHPALCFSRRPRPVSSGSGSERPAARRRTRGQRSAETLLLSGHQVVWRGGRGCRSQSVRSSRHIRRRHWLLQTAVLQGDD